MSSPRRRIPLKMCLKTLERLEKSGKKPIQLPQSVLMEFLAFCMEGNEAAVRSFLKYPININQIPAEKGGGPLLHGAASLNRVKLIELLIQNKANIDLVAGGAAPLHLACWNDSYEAAVSLIKHKANLNLKAENHGMPLHFAAALPPKEMQIKFAPLEKVKIVSLLLEHKADLEAVDKDGFTPFATACYADLLETAELLRKAGANINTIDKESHTPLSLALKNNKPNVVTYLLSHGAKTDVGHKPVFNTVIPEFKLPPSGIKIVVDLKEFDEGMKIFRVYKELMKACDQGGEAGLADVKNLIQEVKKLSQMGMDINCQLPHKDKATALLVACESKDNSDFNLEIVKELVNAGAIYDFIIANRDSALLAACDNGKTKVVEFLLKLRSELDEQELKIATHLLTSLPRDAVNSPLKLKSAYNWHVRTIDGETCVVGRKARCAKDAEIRQKHVGFFNRKIEQLTNAGFEGAELKRVSKVGGPYFSRPRTGMYFYLTFSCRRFQVPEYQDENTSIATKKF